MLKTVMSGSSKENKINLQDSSFYVSEHAILGGGRDGRTGGWRIGTFCPPSCSPTRRFSSSLTFKRTGGHKAMFVSPCCLVFCFIFAGVP